jgi:hypothetical protein
MHCVQHGLRAHLHALQFGCQGASLVPVLAEEGVLGGQEPLSIGNAGAVRTHRVFESYRQRLQAVQPCLPCTPLCVSIARARYAPCPR